MFRMNGTREERLDACRRFAEDLNELPGKIEVLESIEVGINENPSEEWDLVLTAVVPTLRMSVSMPSIRIMWQLRLLHQPISQLGPASTIIFRG